MDTNLKKSKKIRAFCYRMIATGALITAIATAVMGREAFINLHEGGNSFSGDVYELAEFREYISILYNKAMIGYAGVGDDKGYPLTDENANRYSEEALRDFHNMLDNTGDNIVYYVLQTEETENSDDNRYYLTEETENPNANPYYLPGNGVMEDTNLAYLLFSEYDGHLILPENVRLCCYWDGTNKKLHYFNLGIYKGTENTPLDQYYTADYKPNKDGAANLQLVIGLKNDGTSDWIWEMQKKADFYQYTMILFVVSVALWLVSFVCSFFTGKAARQAKEDCAHVSVRIWLEIKTLIAIGVLCFVFWSELSLFGGDWGARKYYIDSMWIYFPLGCLLYLFYVDISRNRKKVLVNCIPVRIFCYFREVVRGMPWYRRTVGWNLTMGIVAFIPIILAVCSFSGSWYTGYISGANLQTIYKAGAFLICAGLILLIGVFKQKRFLSDTALVVDKLSKMKEGNGNVPLILPQGSLLCEAANDLNELEDGIENAVEQQNRSNRMKVELITNVSHDLKTPLTSIINYADLLCEENLPGDAAGYAIALQEKAYRLNKMVQDVFDLSKATSGNLVVEKIVIDLVKLIRQTLADMDERISESNLTFKLNISTEPLMIEADGEKLYRVFQNLFVNALQYSLENSRVYVQLSEEEGFAVARVKNVSRTELDFDTSEIVERFVRADCSRTTEGSGLGLSIVQSFVEACGGQFRVETDADMFTACVRFPLVEQSIEEEQSKIKVSEQTEECKENA